MEMAKNKGVSPSAPAQHFLLLRSALVGPSFELTQVWSIVVNETQTEALSHSCSFCLVGCTLADLILEAIPMRQLLEHGSKCSWILAVLKICVF